MMFDLVFASGQLRSKADITPPCNQRAAPSWRDAGTAVAKKDG
jgi:hypothetical protein